MRISYTIAKAWWDGRKDEALAMINGDPVQFAPHIERAMGYGNGAHDAWELESKLTGRLPAIFKNQDIEVLATELKLYKKLTERDWLVGKLDWLGWHPQLGLIIGDHKTGGKDGWQVPTYHLLTHDNLDKMALSRVADKLKDKNAQQFWYTNLDKLTGETAIDIVKLTYPETKDDWLDPEGTTYTKGYNWIMTVLDDIKNDLGLV